MTDTLAQNLNALTQLDGYHREYCLKQVYNGSLTVPNAKCSCGLQSFIDHLKRANLSASLVAIGASVEQQARDLIERGDVIALARLIEENQRLSDDIPAVSAAQMTKAELIAKLKQIAIDYKGDKEAAHGEADSAILEFINDPEIEAAYDAIEKWYA